MHEKEMTKTLRKIQVLASSDLYAEAIGDALYLLEEKDRQLKNLSEIIDNRSRQIKRLEKEIKDLKSNNKGSFSI